MTSVREVAPYGTWTSPITSSITSARVVMFAELMVNVRRYLVTFGHISDRIPAQNRRAICR